MMLFLCAFFTCCGALAAGSLQESRNALLHEVHDAIAQITLQRNKDIHFETIVGVMEYLSNADPNDVQELYPQLQRALHSVLRRAGLEGTAITAQWNRKNTPGSYATDLQNSAVVGARLGKHQNTDANIIAVMLHELSHIKHHDIQARHKVGICGILALVCSAMALVGATRLYGVGSQYTAIALLFVAVLQLALPIYSLQLAQFQEKRADLFAAEHGFALDLAEDLAAFRDENPGYMAINKNWFVRFVARYLENQHPEVDERIRYLKEYHAQNNRAQESVPTS